QFFQHVMAIIRKGVADQGIPKVSPDPNSRRHAVLEIAGTGGLRTLCRPAVTRAEAVSADHGFTAHLHGGPSAGFGRYGGAATVDFLRIFTSSGSRAWAGADRKIQSNQPHAPRPTAVLLSRRPKIGKSGIWSATPRSVGQAVSSGKTGERRR